MSANVATANQRNILITGCSSGIGAALADEFHARGHTVFATARSESALAALRARGLRAIALDVTDADSIAAAVKVVRTECGHLDMLVNNAGFAQFGAVIDVSVEDMRRQFETNVIAPVAMARAFVPLMRLAKNQPAQIVNIGSISGIAATPFSGVYCASKAAVHSLSDALRMELAPFGIGVVTLQPGGVVSHFAQTGGESVALPADSLYMPLERFIRARAQLSQKGATPAAEFAKVVVSRLLEAQPPAVVRYGAQSTRLPLFKRLLPTKVLDGKMRAMFGLDTPIKGQ